MEKACLLAYHEYLLSVAIDKGVNFTSISKHISIDTINAHPELEWDWYFIKRRQTVTTEREKNNPEKAWYYCDWGVICYRVKWEVIESNPHKNWDWWSISRNHNITWDIIQQNPLINWDWYGVFDNPTIYIPSIAFKAEFLKKWHSRCIINKYLFKCLTDPSYKQCKKRLMREYSKMI